MSKPSDIPQDVAVAALETVLKPLGTSLRHYMPASKEAAIVAMQGVLAAQAERSVEAGYMLGFKASGEGWNGEYPFEGIDPEVNAHWVERRNADVRGEA